MASLGKTLLALSILYCVQVVTINGQFTEYIKLRDGSTVRGHEEDTYQFFLGIPYAKPPVGDLRFANPEPSPWVGNKDTVKASQPCLQLKSVVNATVVGSEDCLYLNIYRPNIEYNAETKLDVMVYIHGGGFFSGTTRPYVTGPTYFMKDKTVILAMMQYRLSVFGFLSTGDRHSPGNFGLKDQAVALKWINENIASFGGNPNSITIFGHGVSVHMHMMSPLSQNLFHKAIAMSGSAIDPYNYPTRNPINLAREQAKAAGIENADSLNSRDLIKNLRKVKPEALMKSFTVNPMSLYRTVVEPQSKTAFLTEDPRILLRNGNFSRIPFMTGVVDEEGVFRGGPIIHYIESNNLRKNLDMEFVIPELLEIHGTDDQLDKFMGKIKRRYLRGSRYLNDANKLGFMHMFTDYAYYYPLYKSLPHMINRIPVYLYKFSYRGQNSFCDSYTGTDSDYGVVHGDELIYLFDSPPDHIRGLNPKDQMASDKLVNAFTQFAKADKPNLPRCYESDMKPICKFTHFYGNSFGKFDIIVASRFGTSFANFWDEVKEIIDFQTTNIEADSKQGTIDNSNMEEVLEEVKDNVNAGDGIRESIWDNDFTEIIDLLKEVVSLMKETDDQSKEEVPLEEPSNTVNAKDSRQETTWYREYKEIIDLSKEILRLMKESEGQSKKTV